MSPARPRFSTRLRAAGVVMGILWLGSALFALVDDHVVWRSLGWGDPAPRRMEGLSFTIPHPDPWHYILLMSALGLPLLLAHLVRGTRWAYRIGLGLSLLPLGAASSLAAVDLLHGRDAYGFCGETLVTLLTPQSPLDQIGVCAMYGAILVMFRLGLERLSERLEAWDHHGWSGLIRLSRPDSRKGQ